MAEMMDEELEALEKRARRRFLMGQLENPDNAGADLGLKLAAGGMDLLSKNAQDSQDIMSIMTGIKGPNQRGPGIADQLQKTLAAKATERRQRALDDRESMSAIQRMIDRKREIAMQDETRARQSTERNQDLFAKGYMVGEDGSLSMIKGGAADLANQKAQADIAKALAEAAKSRSGSGTGIPGGRDTYVPGVGDALTKDDAKQLKDATVMKAKLDRQLQEMINLRKQYGTEYANRAAVARGQQLSKDILLTYKNLQKLGVLSRSDEDIINAIIPSDPLQTTWSTFGIGKDPILSNLESFKADNEKDYQANLEARLRPGQRASNASPEDLEALNWLRQNPDDPDAAGVSARLKGKGLI